MIKVFLYMISFMKSCCWNVYVKVEAQLKEIKVCLRLASVSVCKKLSLNGLEAFESYKSVYRMHSFE